MANAYKCTCGAKVTRELVGQEVGRRKLCWCCSDSQHGEQYGYPYFETDWEAAEFDPSPTLTELEPWPEEEVVVESACQHKPSNTRTKSAVLYGVGLSAASVLLAIGWVAMVWALAMYPWNYT